MKDLLKQHKKYQNADVLWDYSKIKGEFSAGCMVKIFWGKEYKGIVDEGYAFMLPICDYTDDYDFFVHIPKPDNSEGIGEGDPQWNHVSFLLTNEYVNEIELINKF